MNYILETGRRRKDIGVTLDTLCKCESYWKLVAEQFYTPYSDYVMKDGISNPNNAITNFTQVATQLECYPLDSKSVIDFIIEYVLEPMKKYEPLLCKTKFDLSIQHLSNGNKLYAVIYFALLSSGSTRHYIYPSRLSCVIQPEFSAWLRRLDQGKPMWSFLRCLFLGASNVAAIVGANEEWESRNPNPADRKGPQRLLTDCRGLTQPKPFSPIVQLACIHGTKNEDLGRDLYCNLTGNIVIEIGTAVSPQNSCFTHSPDGLVMEKGLAQWSPNIPFSLSSDTEVFHRKSCYISKQGFDIFSKASGLCGKIEIKCQFLKNGTYEKCPTGYIPQCLQGMLVHGVPWCDFVGVYYVPQKGIHSPDEIQFTIERIHYNEEVMQWMQSCFNSFSTSLASGDDELSRDFYFKFEKRIDPLTRKHMFSKLKREHISVWKDGLRLPAKCLKMNLEEALGCKQLATKWKQINGF